MLMPLPRLLCATRKRKIISKIEKASSGNEPVRCLFGIYTSFLRRILVRLEMKLISFANPQAAMGTHITK